MANLEGLDLGQQLYIRQQELAWTPNSELPDDFLQMAPIYTYSQEYAALPDELREEYEDLAQYVVAHYLYERANRQYRINCSGCGRFIPKSAVHKAGGYEVPSWAADWDCPHCGIHDGNY
ncbi:MAG TPA: hypothetical protein VGE45_00420 [Chloroflexia bacterium]|jgi:hypothetical protein